MEGLGALLGLAPSPVLQGRLARCGLPAPATPPHLDDPGWATLVDAVTIQETRLFRHPALLQALSDQVLPALRAVAGGRALRMVSAGCATGEEAYTLAMLAAAGGPAGVLGFDVSRPALAAAGLPRWPTGFPDPARDVPPAFRHWLEPVDGTLCPAPALQAMVRFRRANLLALPPGLLRQEDLILCRNVLIYLHPPARAQALAALTGALAPGGALMLGPSDAPPAGLGLRPWGGGASCVWRRA